MPGPELRRAVLSDERVADLLLHAHDFAPVTLEGGPVAAQSLALT